MVVKFAWSTLMFVRMNGNTTIKVPDSIGPVLCIALRRSGFGRPAVRSVTFRGEGAGRRLDGDVSGEAFLVSSDVAPVRVPHCDYVVIAYMNKGAPNMDEFDREVLEHMGFAHGLASDVPAAPAHHHVLIHCCCERGNLLTRPLPGSSIRMVDITKDEDFTKRETIDHVKSMIRGPGDVF